MEVKPGQPIRAADINAIARVAGRQAVAGRGATATSGAGGVILAISRLLGRYAVPARIKAVSTANRPATAAAVTYDAQPIGLPDSARMLGRKPDLGRPVAPEDEADRLIYPAQVGDLCFVAQVPGDEGKLEGLLVVLTEHVATRACGQAAQDGGNSAAGSHRPAHPPPPPPPPPPATPPGQPPAATKRRSLLDRILGPAN